MATIKFKQVTPVVEDASRSERHETPSHAVTVAAQVGIPFMWSLVLTIAVVLATWWLSAKLELDGGVLVPMFALATFIGSFLWQSGIFRSLLWDVEERLDKDLDGDGKQGRPETYTDHLEVEVKDDHGLALPGGFNTEEIGWSRTAAIHFFSATIDNPIFTEARWAKTVEFRQSPTFFRQVMTYLEEQGILERVGEGRNATRQFTRAGMAIARKIAALPH